MSLLAAITAVVLVSVNQFIPSYWYQDKFFIFSTTSIADARNVLNAVADTALAIIGVVFSITLVPLTIASSQYGSIVLRSFLRDRGTQIVLGAYSATTFYCLFLLLRLRNVTLVSVLDLPLSIALYMLIISLMMLLYFFHHVADSLQASAVVEQVSRELESIIEETPPSEKDALLKYSQDLETARRTVMHEGYSVTSTRKGYIRAIDFNRLMRVATERKLVLHLTCSPGDFVGRGDPLLLVSPTQPDEEFRTTINRAYFLGRNRTLFQDPEFGIYLIVIIAVRALSPAINDPYTPVLCLNRLGSALSILAEHDIPFPHSFDRDGKLRLIVEHVTFDRLVGVSFNMIREYGRGSTEVLLQMLDTIKSVANHVHSENQRQVLLMHARLIDDSRLGLSSDYDKQRVHNSFEELVLQLGRPDVSLNGVAPH